MVNVACGFHAGGPVIMRRTVIEACSGGVAFGVPCPASGAGAVDLVARQVGAVVAICALESHPMTYLKTYSALGNACDDDEGLVTMAVACAVKAVDPG